MDRLLQHYKAAQAELQVSASGSAIVVLEDSPQAQGSSSSARGAAASEGIHVSSAARNSPGLPSSTALQRRSTSREVAIPARSLDQELQKRLEVLDPAHCASTATQKDNRQDSSEEQQGSAGLIERPNSKNLLPEGFWDDMEYGGVSPCLSSEVQAEAGGLETFSGSKSSGRCKAESSAVNSR